MPGSTRIIPLGGLGEVGKNMTVFEADGDAVVVDAGLAFPRDEHLGVDLILPDFSYLVDLFLGDSTNAERPGVTGSERLVGEAFRQLIPPRTGRILVASFASNVHRMQQAADVAIEAGRKVCVVGRSMRKNINIARNLGYIDVPDEALIQPKELDDYPRGDVLILCTGSQGEPLSALVRIAYGNHRDVQVEAGDTVIISAKPVPGNELAVHDAINQLAKNGAEVLHQEIAPVHVSGHGHAEELRTMLGLVRPKSVMPVHGEFRMLAAHARLAVEGGIPENRIVLAENGSVVELDESGAYLTGQIEAGVTFVDGLGVGDVQDVALRDRRHLSEDGVLIIVATLGASNGSVAGKPELIARGFAEPGEPLLEEMREEAQRVLDELVKDDVREIKLLQEHLHDGLGQLIYDRTKRRPMILPVVVQV